MPSVQLFTVKKEAKVQSFYHTKQWWTTAQFSRNIWPSLWMYIAMDQHTTHTSYQCFQNLATYVNRFDSPQVLYQLAELLTQYSHVSFSLTFIIVRSDHSTWIVGLSPRNADSTKIFLCLIQNDYRKWAGNETTWGYNTMVCTCFAIYCAFPDYVRTLAARE